MATSNKDFRIKNGLVVEGANATINGEDVLTTGSSILEQIPSLVSSPEPPENPSSGDFWLRSVSGSLYVYYVDETSGQWVQVG